MWLIFSYKTYTMKNFKLFLIITFLTIFSVNAQNTIVNSEVGVFLGPVFMQTDYGEAQNFSSASSNVGMNFGAAYIMDLSDSKYSSKMFQNYADYVKTRIELSYSKVNLNYDGKPIDDGSQIARFEAMKGETKIFNIGLLQEINFKSIIRNSSKFRPYGLLGLHYSSASPNLSTNQPLPTIFLPENENVFMEKQSTFSWTAGLGARYQLDDVDIFIETRYHNFFSDKIEGLDSNISGDKHNDNEIIFNFGVIFKLDNRKK